MERIESHEYFAQCEAIAREAVKEAEGDREQAHERATESIGGHQWMIYTYYFAQVLDHSSNENAYFEDFGPLEADGYMDAMGKMAYAAFSRDVFEYLETALDEYEAPESDGSEGDE